MTDQEINVAIAEICGYKNIRYDYGNGWTTCKEWLAEHPNPNVISTGIPSYTSDLDAMFQAWSILDRKQRISFSHNLREVVVYAGMSAYNEDIVALCENATAYQRAKAFLKTFNKWK